MEVGLGVDSRLGLSTAQLRDLAVDAKRLGYTSMWTNAGTDYDPIALCVAWHQFSGLATGISVVPIARNPPEVLALAARTAHELCGGRFVLGVGSGGVAERPIRAVRDYVAAIRKIAPDVRVAVGALGPQMLRLASRVAEAAALNWCTPAQLRWSRDAVGPRARLIEYIRVCVDSDTTAARLALARQIVAYAGRPRPSGATGYRAHFERMGFASELGELDELRERNASDDDLARAVPERLVSAMGYHGDGVGALERFAQLATGLDVAIVRVLSPRPGDLAPVRRAMETFAPGR
jgi:alkanesulfonate monooxygenase SsuD/methylene tetrahydromethanopterin reductase-like flavin-dependent oxidoreductase (luciferase family)